jgi:hypothetical protein
MDNIELNLNQAERKTKDITIKNRPKIFELVQTMMNLYINGFNLIENPSNKINDTDRVWLALVTRSLHSLICSVELMKRGYYAQSITLIRMVIEAYFLCGNCEQDKTITDALLYNKSNKPNGKIELPSWRELARNMGALAWYRKDYKFACQFSHMSHITLEAMTTKSNPSYRDLKLVPSYDELAFVACSKLLLRNGLLMTAFLGKLLDDISKGNVAAWHMKARTAVQQVEEWSGKLKARRGGR